MLSDFSIELIGLTAGTLTTVSFLPQLFRTYRRRSAEDLSYSYLGMFGAGVALWLIYGLLIHSIAVIVANVATLALVLGLTGMKAHYARGKEHPIA